MGHVDAATKQMLDIKFMEGNGAWGLIHEIGHNVQWISGFYVNNYIETTNNFWTLYVSQKVSLKPKNTELYML